MPEQGTNTIIFMFNIYSTRTYLRVVVAFKPTKADPYRIRWTVIGNRIDYLGNKYTPNADTTTCKLFLNSVIATNGTKFMKIDLKDFHLNTPT